MQLFTVQEAAEKLRISKASLNRWRGTGEGPNFMKLGGAVRYRDSDINEWLEAQLIASTSANAA